MSWMSAPPLDEVLRRRDALELDERRLQSTVRRGEFTRIARGSFAPTHAWAELSPVERHAQRVWEAAARMAPGRIFSHASAAAIHGIESLGAWPARIDISGDGIGGSSGAIRRHARNPESLAVMPWHDHFVTSPAQTAVDQAATLPYVQGVAVADQVLWVRRPGGALATPEELGRVADRYAGRAHARVRRVVEFARADSDSVRESQSRVLIDQLGFPAPVLQQRFTLARGRRAYTDFWWPDYSLIGEFDGIGKYFDPVLGRGRTPEQILIDEKDRADELRRQVRALARWRTPALHSPRLLYDILRAEGLPSSRARPGK